MSNSFTHLNAAGEAVMVDVTDKQETKREAIAKGKIYASKPVIEAILNQTNQKGDVLGIARIAGIMAAKKTSDLIPLCHPLNLTKCTLDFEVFETEGYIEASCLVKVSQKTGVEMEALTGLNVALLTIYDMCKAIDKSMRITDIHLTYKSGGKSGVYQHVETK